MKKKMNRFIFVIGRIILFILEEYVFTQTRYFWIGGILPILFIILVLYIIIRLYNQFTLLDWFAAITLFTPLAIWGDGHERYTRKIKKEKNEWKLKI